MPKWVKLQDSGVTIFGRYANCHNLGTFRQTNGNPGSHGVFFIGKFIELNGGEWR